MSDAERPVSKAADGMESSWSTARSLNTPDAREYCEWVLLVRDLEYALRRAELWRGKARSAAAGTEDMEICVSLLRDAVVALVACFDTTSPVHLDAPSVYGETPGGTEYFQWLKNLRHTWIGHRGGPQRQCVAAVLIDESTGEFRGFGHLHQSWVGPKAEAGGDFARMIEIALVHAQRKLERCESAVKGVVQGMTNRERRKLPVANTVVPGQGEIHMGRRKFRNIKNGGRRKSAS